MKANDFVKKYGWEEAKKVIKNAHWEDISYGNGHYYSNSCSKDDVLLDDLKRLIESHDLLEKLGGLDKAEDFYNSFGTPSGEHRIYQAIADVESCQ